MNRSVPACGPLAACCAIVLGAAFARAENWPQWRGPTQNGISNEKGLPSKWSETENVVWKLPLAKGSSTPVIWGDRLFVTSAVKKDLFLHCISTEGKELWKRQFGTASLEIFQSNQTNGASASASTDGKHVFVFSERGDLCCFDYEGKEVWKFNVEKSYGKFQTNWGVHTTPYLHENRLYLSIMHRKLHYVLSVDKVTGKVIWKIDRETDAKGESNESYSTPAVWSNGKDSYLVILGADYATGHSLKDGSEIWRLGDLNSATKYNQAFRIIASPLATPELIVIPTAANRGADAVVAVKPEAKGFIKAGTTFEQWRFKGSPDVPSPLVCDGLVYLCAAETGLLTCLDAKTGKPHYEKQSLERSIYRASPVYADGKIYVTARNGTFHVIKHGPKYELLAVNRLPDTFTASPAISNGRIYLRGWEALYAIQEKGK